MLEIDIEMNMSNTKSFRNISWEIWKKINLLASLELTWYLMGNRQAQL